MSVADFAHLTALSVVDAWRDTVPTVFAVTPSPKDPKEVDTSGIIEFFASKIAPILLAVLGLIFIGRANKGEVSRVLTSSAIAVVGLVFIAGAVTLVFVGDTLIGLIFK